MGVDLHCCVWIARGCQRLIVYYIYGYIVRKDIWNNNNVKKNKIPNRTSQNKSSNFSPTWCNTGEILGAKILQISFRSEIQYSPIFTIPIYTIFQATTKHCRVRTYATRYEIQNHSKTRRIFSNATNMTDVFVARGNAAPPKCSPSIDPSTPLSHPLG